MDASEVKGGIVGGFEEHDNTSPETFHAGTREAATTVDNSYNRPYLHRYEIDRSRIHPVTYGDVPDTFNEGNRTQVSDALANKGIDQPELFETIPTTKKILKSTKEVIPYRNALEDTGSISYIIPKDTIRRKESPAVKYLGVESNPRYRYNS